MRHPEAHLSPQAWRAVTWLREQITPQAERLDRDPAALGEALDAMGRAGLLGLKVPAAEGGLGLAPTDAWQVQEAAARASGALAFLQTQHQSAAAFVASGQGPLRDQLLPQLVAGQVKAGIAYGHLRRRGPPLLRAMPGPVGGLRLHGEAPWFTGWGMLSWSITAAHLPEGEIVFLAHPARQLPGLRPGAVMRLAAMEVCQTVALHYDGLEIPADHVLFRAPGTWISENDRGARARQAAFACGCAASALDVVDAAALARAEPPFHASTLRRALADTRHGLLAELASPSDPQRALDLRADAITLAVRCAHAAVIAHSGASNAVGHAAQRVYREALAFSVLALSGAVREATLSRLDTWP